ncbi:DUF5993 family protein [Methylobacterium marchantiae]|uniref:DUF5993 family protein n=1 Tax=Methylobacterium marchantiae TaxID=600331 RepID=A0ABW3X194_9HYPH|nr:hypothetical protein AIGOOFII_1021 [Methylobacterium marchantiae]
MMVIPFLGFAGATGAALAGRRGLALAVWGLSLGVLMALFREHATDALQLVF